MTLYPWHGSTHHQRACLFVINANEKYAEHPGPDHHSLLKAICHQMESFPDGADDAASAAEDPLPPLRLACSHPDCHACDVGDAY